MAQRQWRSDDTDKWKYAFGNGSNGSSYSVPTNEGCSGTASTKSLTLASAGSFANGDLVLIHQSRGTGAGAWELNKIASGGGGTSLTMVHDLMNTYTDSGASQAQIIKLNEYKNLTISGSTSVPAWDGSKGGIIAFLDSGTTTISNTLSADGYGGVDFTPDNTWSTVNDGGGFRGGASHEALNSWGYQGESAVGVGTNSQSANGAGGGGGGGNYSFNSGGGAGNGTAGSAGSGGGADGVGGSTDGAASLVDMVFGAGGGGTTGTAGVGGVVGGTNGGGIICIFSKNIVVTGAVNSDGGSTNIARALKGGAGSGGSILFKCETAILGSSLVTALGGTVNLYSPYQPGAGGVGRIHIDYSKSYTGTTNPTIDARQDATIRSIAGGAFMLSHFV